MPPVPRSRLPQAQASQALAPQALSSDALPFEPSDPPAAAGARLDQREATLRATARLADLGRIAGHVAHDFNNILATLIGNLELLEHRLGTSSDDPAADRARTLIARAAASVQRAAALTSGVLALARPASGGARPIDPGALLADFADLLRATLGRRISLTLAIAPGLRLVALDPTRLRAALLVLCLNARDALPEGGAVTIALDTEEVGSMLRLSVTDTGTGMAPEVRARACEAFFTTKGPEAAGLGLTEVAELAREAGGSFVLDSSEGQGTTACLLLPSAARPAAPPAAPNGAPPGAPPGG